MNYYEDYVKKKKSIEDHSLFAKSTGEDVIDFTLFKV